MSATTNCAPNSPGRQRTCPSARGAALVWRAGPLFVRSAVSRSSSATLDHTRGRSTSARCLAIRWTSPRGCRSASTPRSRRAPDSRHAQALRRRGAARPRSCTRVSHPATPEMDPQTPAPREASDAPLRARARTTPASTRPRAAMVSASEKVRRPRSPHMGMTAQGRGSSQALPPCTRTRPRGPKLHRGRRRATSAAWVIAWVIRALRRATSLGRASTQKSTRSRSRPLRFRVRFRVGVRVRDGAGASLHP
jgi:hypothetical protein